jgi:hypothetical protein
MMVGQGHGWQASSSNIIPDDLSTLASTLSSLVRDVKNEVQNFN